MCGTQEKLNEAIYALNIALKVDSHLALPQTETGRLICASRKSQNRTSRRSTSRKCGRTTKIMFGFTWRVCRVYRSLDPTAVGSSLANSDGKPGGAGLARRESDGLRRVLRKYWSHGGCCIQLLEHWNTHRLIVVRETELVSADRTMLCSQKDSNFNPPFPHLQC